MSSVKGYAQLRHEVSAFLRDVQLAELTRPQLSKNMVNKGENITLFGDNAMESKEEAKH